MACNSCAKPFNLLRKEKGCPSCGFSYCSKCLNMKVFLKKLNKDLKVCSKCERLVGAQEKPIPAPDIFYRRLGVMNSYTANDGKTNPDKNYDADEEIRSRLEKLKKERLEHKAPTEDEIQNRLQNIKGTQPSTTEAELQLRLAKLKGLPDIEVQEKPILQLPEFKTEQEQADQLMKQYLESVEIDTQYEQGFQKQIEDIQSRLQNLRGTDTPACSKNIVESEEEDDVTIKRIIEKAKAESILQCDDLSEPKIEELPFCEICNEDAHMRCLGCQYLFCRQCFKEHKDDDDGCNRYELYDPKMK